MGSRRFVIGLGACAVLIESGLLLIAGLERPASHVPAFISHYLLTSTCYLVACWLVVQDPGQSPRRWTVRLIWGAALVFRLTVVPLDPSLSEDTARYRWLGMLQDAGGDPYRDLPEDPSWRALRDETWPRVAGKDKPSSYGPVVEQVNLWYYRLVRSWTSDPWTQVRLFKIPFAVADLFVGLVLMVLLSSSGKPRTWVLIYLWSPLTIIEFWVEGHNDALAVLFVVMALLLSLRARTALASGCLAVATMCKFWPAILLPFLLLTRERERWTFQGRGALVFAGVALAASFLYGGSVLAVLDVLEGFAGQWRNNDSLFALFLALAGGEMQTAAGISKWTLVTGVLTVRFLSLRPFVGELTAVCLLLLVSANCLPWYLTWMSPLLAVHPVPPLLLWSALVSLAYHVVPGYEATGIWVYDPVLTRMEYLPVLIWLAWVAVRGARDLRSQELPRAAMPK